MTDHNTPPGTVASDYTMLDVLDGVMELQEPGVTELADHLDLAKSTVHKHLKTLNSRGLLSVNEGSYRLTLKFLEYGGHVRDRNRVYRFGRPKVEELAEEINEMVILTARDGTQGVFLFRTNNRYGIQNLIPMGERFHLHQNAAGRAMLAEYSDAEVEEFAMETGLPEAMEKTITDTSELIEEIQRVRDEGFATGRGERFEGIHPISAAIPDSENRYAVGAISIVVPDDSAIAERIESEYAEILIHATREVGLQLKYDEPSIDVP